MIDLERFAPVVFADSKDRFLEGVAIHGTETHGWLQYWLGWSGDRDHAGTDWELVMLQPPHRAVFAQHRTARERDWMQCARDGDRIHVYASRDKHAALFRPGWHRHGWRWDKCDGEVKLDLPLVFGVPLAVSRRRAFQDPDGWLASR